MAPSHGAGTIRLVLYLHSIPPIHRNMFDTGRLILRAFRESDMPDLMALANDLESQKLSWVGYISPRPPKFEETIRGWVRALLRSDPGSC